VGLEESEKLIQNKSFFAFLCASLYSKLQLWIGQTELEVMLKSLIANFKRSFEFDENRFRIFISLQCSTKIITHEGCI
jgi:hypothetical protein